MVERALSTSVARWTLVLSVLFGVLAMHALVLGRSDHLPAAFADPASPSPASVAAAAHVPAASAPVAHPVAVHGSAVAAAGHGDGDAPAGHAHGVLHLCLAVLTALAGLLTAPLLAQLLRPAVAGSGPGAGPVHRAATGPATRPPPSAVRLAQLCVLRT